MLLNSAKALALWFLTLENSTFRLAEKKWRFCHWSRSSSFASSSSFQRREKSLKIGVLPLALEADEFWGKRYHKNTHCHVPIKCRNPANRKDMKRLFILTCNAFWNWFLWGKKNFGYSILGARHSTHSGMTGLRQHDDRGFRACRFHCVRSHSERLWGCRLFWVPGKSVNSGWRMVIQWISIGYPDI